MTMATRPVACRPARSGLPSDPLIPALLGALVTDDLTAREIGALLKFHPSNVRRWCRSLGLPQGARDSRLWTAEDDRLLIELHGLMPTAQLAELLGRSIFATKARRQQITPDEEKRTQYPIWSAEEIDRLSRAWPTSSIAQLMKVLPGRTKEAIGTRAKMLGLRKRVPAGITLESQLPPEIREVLQLVNKLRKATADEEHRRSSSHLVR